MKDRKSKTTRHGVHSDDAFRVSFYLTAHEKAIAVVLAEHLGKTFTEICKDGLVYVATANGVMLNGMVTQKFADEVRACEDILNAEKKVGAK